MKTYYIKYPRNFANEYNLCYCETPEERKAAEAAGWEKITRKEAIRKCAAERWARKNDPAFSGFGDVAIAPWAYIAAARIYPITPEEYGLTLNGYIWE